MGGPVDHIDSKNLVPFKKRRNGYHLPVLTKDAEEKVIDEVDPELRPEEQSYVRHYLNYADLMLKNCPAEEGPPQGENAGATAQESPQAKTSAQSTDVSDDKSNVTEIPLRGKEDGDDGEDSHAA